MSRTTEHKCDVCGFISYHASDVQRAIVTVQGDTWPFDVCNTCWTTYKRKNTFRKIFDRICRRPK
jgi:hypothetical protein